MGNRVARTVGRYEILDELGRGGMATVYLARQTDLDRLVALKELSAFRQADPAFTQRFLRESRLAGSLSHPNIVTVHDYFEYDGAPYIAMEYVDGGSLRPHIGHISLTQVAGVMEGVLSALDHAEHHGIVHRDLKPENVMVTSQGRVKITDFGIAKATGSAHTGSFLTATGTTVGTPNYIAPEQAMGQEVGPWTDLYSLGVMAFELFVGHVPFYDTEEPVAVLMRQVSDPIPPARTINPEVDEGISDWIERLVVKDPRKRIRSADHAWDEFEEIILELVGPRWRRSAPLVPSSKRPADAPAGPHTPPPTAAARPPLMPTWSVPNWGPTMAGAPTRRLRDDEDAAVARTVMPEEPTHRLDDPDEPPESRRGVRGTLLKLGLVILATVAVLAAAFGGRGSNPGGSSEAPALAPVSTVTGPDMTLQVPRGWRRARSAPDVGLPLSHPVAAAPGGRAAGPAVVFGLVKGNRAANSTLLPAAFLSSTGQSSGSAPSHPVRLPTQSLEALRYAGLRPVGIPRELTVYTVPTSAGVATVACAVPSGRAAALAAQCDAIAGTLRLRKATAYPVGASDAYATALNGAIGELQQTTGFQETALQNAQTLADQAAAANALASAYDAAAGQLAALSLSPADRQANHVLVAALRGAGAAYRKAARAATGGDAAAYRTASAAVPPATAQVNSALAGVRAAGYGSQDQGGSSGAGPTGGKASGNAGGSAGGSGAGSAGGNDTTGSGNSRQAPPGSDVGDSRSDDPSDDSEDP
ncbi:MAG TPA: serine/threonine-protein kinase [Asanoa sp.]